MTLAGLDGKPVYVRGDAVALVSSGTCNLPNPEYQKIPDGMLRLAKVENGTVATSEEPPSHIPTPCLVVDMRTGRQATVADTDANRKMLEEYLAAADAASLLTPPVDVSRA